MFTVKEISGHHDQHYNHRHLYHDQCKPLLSMFIYTNSSIKLKRKREGKVVAFLKKMRRLIFAQDFKISLHILIITLSIRVD